MVEKYFGSWKKGRQPGAKIPVKITDRKKEKRETFDKNQTHMVIGFLGPKSGSADYYPFRVLDSVLSGGMSSRLFTEVRDKRNLCYTVYSTFDRTVERGAFKIYTATSPENEQAAYDAIMDVLRDLEKNGITEDELKSAKAHINGMYKIGMQDYMGRADSYVSYEILGLGYENVDKFPENINAVTVDDVKAVIKKYFNLDGMTKAVVGAAVKKKKEQSK
ncbi:MAG: Peptidase M16 inactive domain protein [Candidatus Aerophobetes bacterium ADurb.Bin490]|nr:MAG: Peptidase M16 inactive domain protein [Candidatus Aerophobetes bacterium ADurb.Bin490]